ncbi:MAG: hypothetical protein Q4F31_08025 [Eubacteriales bacterium]|nr:hypothetical protein [Eubacteriales bacterium]
MLRNSLKKLSFVLIFFSLLILAGSAYAETEKNSSGSKKSATGSVIICGTEYPADTKTLDLFSLKPEDVSKAAEKLPEFTALKKVILSPADESGNEAISPLSFAEFQQLADAAPDADFSYCFELYHQTVSTDETEELMFRRLTDVDDAAVDAIDEVLPYLKQLKTVSFNRCPASYDRLDALREKYPDITVRWVVQFAAFTAWSDTDRIWAMAGLYHDEDAVNLKYFHDIRYLDIGHNGLTKCDFLYEMPELEVLIIAIGNLEDITPVASLSKLEYLEICDTQVKDLSPLASCTTLEHLNLGGIPATDLSPLYELKNLKRLFADNMYSIQEIDRLNYEAEFRTLLPNAEISFLMGPGGGVENGYWRFSRGPYTGSYVPRYALLREQFGYDHDENQAYVYD